MGPITKGRRRGSHLGPVIGLLILTAIGSGDAAAQIPPPLPDATPPRSGVTEPPDDALGGALVPGQAIEPIDLATALRLAGARDLDVAIAKERVCQALAELDQARVLWLPSLYLGPNWIRHDGRVQTVEGVIKNVSKSSLFLGGTAAAGSSVSGPIPAGGPAQVSGLTSILRFSDAIFLPLAARQTVAAQRAGVQVATNDALLGVAEAYLDLQQAAGTLAIAREAAANAESLADLTASYASSGTGLEADHRRALAERDRQRRAVEAAVGELESASAELVRRVRLDPRVVVAPVEPPETVIHLVADGRTLDDLITAGLRNRPELAEGQALVQATLTRLKQAKLRPLIPSLALRYSGGGFGGGVNSFFGNLSGRSDADVNLYWELQNLGFADRAIARSSAAQQRTALLQLMKIQDRVASEVVRAEKSRIAADRQVREAGRALPEAINSLSLNFTNIRRGAGLPGATRPIEVLQPIQALAQARADYLAAVLANNRAQFRLYHAIGQAPLSSQARASHTQDVSDASDGVKAGSSRR
jgi:outer membrane protein TolC